MSKLSAKDAARAALGRAGEDFVAAWLVENGYEIVARNWRAAGGEIDIIAKDGECLCFIEVRTKTSRACGDPLETIDAAKRARIALAAMSYVERHGLEDALLRFDVAGVVPCGERFELCYIKAAFECGE